MVRDHWPPVKQPVPPQYLGTSDGVTPLTVGMIADLVTEADADLARRDEFGATWDDNVTYSGPPGPHNDSRQDIKPGANWMHGGRRWVCLDATPGQARWLERFMPGRAVPQPEPDYGQPWAPHARQQNRKTHRGPAWWFARIGMAVGWVCSRLRRVEG